MGMGINQNNTTTNGKLTHVGPMSRVSQNDGASLDLPLSSDSDKVAFSGRPVPSIPSSGNVFIRFWRWLRGETPPRPNPPTKKLGQKPKSTNNPNQSNQSNHTYLWIGAGLVTIVGGLWFKKHLTGNFFKTLTRPPVVVEKPRFGKKFWQNALGVQFFHLVARHSLAAPFFQNFLQV